MMMRQFRTEDYRRVIDAIDQVLAVPLPRDTGATTDRLRGSLAYADEMRRATPVARQLIRTLRQGDNYDGELDETLETLRCILFDT